jgi:hypothetical protein
MTTAIASGLGATLGYGSETTWDTWATPTEWVTFQKESMTLKKGTVQSNALHGGLYSLAARRAYVTHTVDGAFDMDLYDRSQGLLWSQMLGGTRPTPTQIATTGAYYTVFTPGDTTGVSMSFQVARPETSGTVVPFSWSGCKVTDWTVNVAAGQQASLSLSVDGATESIAQTYGAPSYTTSNMLHFAEGNLLLGGTIVPAGTVLTITAVSTANPGVVTSTAHGLATGDIVTIASVGGATQANGTWPVTKLTANTFSIPINVSGTYTSGGTATTVATRISGSTSPATPVVKSCQIKGTNAMALDRFFLGANGTKGEQLANGFRTITGSIDCEFENTTDYYAAYVADTPTALELVFTGPTIVTGTDAIQSQVSILIPSVYFDTGEPNVDGPTVLHAQANFTGLDNGTNPPISVQTISLDSAL